MNRQQTLHVLWKRLFLMLAAMAVLCLVALAIGAEVQGGVLVFLIGNIGGYVGFHKSLGELKDEEVIGLGGSWWAMVAPSFVGGVLAMVLYLLFLSGILDGDLFPNFTNTENASGVMKLLAQEASEMSDYAKLFFWAFVAGFNQKHVVDLIQSVKAK